MTAPPIDDFVAPFQIEGQSVRGRVARLGAAADEVLTRHAYPEPVANLLGEACALAALVGASLTLSGRLIVQAQGDGPAAYVVADYDASGAIRGYCRFDDARVAQVSGGFARPGAASLLGKGVFIMTIDQDGGERYQGVTDIEGETLALCAESYFARSVQTPTRIRLAVGRVGAGESAAWRVGGLLIQNIAADETRGPTEAAWERAQVFFETVGEDELIDPALGSETLLWRLFHEDGVRLFGAKPLRGFCRCSEPRILAMLRAFPPEERLAMVEADGRIKVTCEYCSRVYELAPESV